MSLPPGVLRYLIIGQVIITAFINFAINLILGWLTYSGSPTVATWTLDKGAVGDMIGTCYLLPAITCFIATWIVRLQAASGVVSRIPLHDAGSWVRYFRGHLFWRATKFGLFGMATSAGPVFMAFWLLAGESVPTLQFLFIKVTFAVLLGIFFTPMIAIVALTDEPKT